MNDRRKIKLIEKYLEKGAYDEIVKEMSADTKKSTIKHLNYLIEYIPTSTLEGLIDNERLLSPMLNVELINFIISELREQGAVWKSKQDIFKLLAPELDFLKYRSSWFDWLNPKKDDKNTTKTEIKIAIENRLNLNSHIWSEPEYKQEQIIPQKVKEFLTKKDEQPKINEGIDLSSLISLESSISNEQKEIILQIEESGELDIKKILKVEFEQFSFSSDNQKFLLKALPLLYGKGCYESLRIGIFPHLFPKYRERIDVKIKEANTLANIENPNYTRVIELLNSIPYNSHEEEVDIKTAIISNIRRSHLNSKKIKLEELDSVLLFIIENYEKVYRYKKPYHYYPAINLAYMVRLLSLISPHHNEIKKYNLEEIYSSVKVSIRKEKKASGDSPYYATISELEFLLLLDYYDIKSKIEYILENLKPTTFLVERTLNQMEWFVNTMEQFGVTESKTSLRFREVIGLFEDYLDYIKR